MFTNHQLEAYIGRLEEAEPSENLKKKIDALYTVVHGRYERQELDQRTFIELRSRLWSLREAFCEALLPQRQRQKTGSRIW